MTLDEARRKARNPGAFFPGERFLIINTATGEPIQSSRDKARAEADARTLNEHEARNGRPAVYGFEPVTYLSFADGDAEGVRS
jgi:hypothetical protein